MEQLARSGIGGHRGCGREHARGQQLSQQGGMVYRPQRRVAENRLPL